MAKKADKKNKAPIRKANHYMKAVPGAALKLLALAVAVVILGLLFSGLQVLTAGWLRMAIAAAVGAVLALLYYSEGVGRGAADAMNSQYMARLESEGKTISAEEDAKCYHPMKAVLAGALAFCVPFVLAVIVALSAKEYTYVLQDLPTWLTGNYAVREDVLGPLSAYMQVTGASAVDLMRVVARLFTMVFINFFADPLTMSLTIDRCVPAFVLVYPIAYVIGYLRGPAANAKLEKQNKKAKKAAVRKHKRAKVAAELLGQSSVPHYGHKRESEKPKKKELI